jgi:hypothetical protein
MALFSTTKHEYLSVLTNMANRIIFPYHRIEAIKKTGFIEFVDIAQKYNKSIIKLRLLKLQFEKIYKFGLFFDSKYYWNKIISKHVHNVNNCIAKLEKLFTFDETHSYFFNQSGVTSDTIKIFLIVKEQNKYMLKTNTTTTCYTYQELCNMLPRTIISELGRNSYCEFGTLQLDPTDTFL